MSVQRLPNGNTFIATQTRLVEVDRAGKELYAIDNVPGKVFEAYRARSGAIVCLTSTNQCLILDTSGKQLQTFASNHGGTGSLHLSANGHILVAQPGRKKVAEFDFTGKLLREVDVPGVTAAVGLPGGRILVSSQDTQRLYELDRSGKVVWEHKNAGKVFRARRR
jgi:outer membrane protein assembly factor BamB